MFFRNQFKELIVALDLTKSLEDALIKDGATGSSLSDKIKSYQEYDEEEYIEAFGEEGDDIDELSYAFREYKRSLLGGLYNDLRWVAHERNQVMHFPNYLIEDFAAFKRVSQDAIAYFGGQGYKKRFLAQISYFLKILLIIAIVATVVYFEWSFFGKYLQNIPTEVMQDIHSKDWIGLAMRAFLSFVIIALAFQLIALAVEILNLLLQLFSLLVLFMLRYWYIIIVAVLSALLWNKDPSYLHELYMHCLKIWEVL